MNPELVLDAKAALGEGPLWSAKDRCLYWVDIDAGHVHLFDPVSAADRTIRVGQAVGTVVPRRRGGVMLALRHGFASLDLQTERVEMLVDPQPDEGTRFNDGKCDPAGRFWAGTLDPTDAPRRGALYRLDADLSVHTMIPRVTIANGIAWSLDARTLYFIDTPTLRVTAFDYDNHSGNIANPRTVVEIPEEDGWPDGMAIDAAGNLWIGMWEGYQVGCWNPRTGRKLASIRVPAKRVTACAFGGENLDELYITTARMELSDEELEEHPHSGGIFRVKPGVRGIRAFEFAG